MKYLSIQNNIKDATGNTISFAIGEDHQFYMVYRDKSAPTGWQKFNLTNNYGQAWQAHAFHVSQNQSGQLFVALAFGLTPDEPSQLVITEGISNDLSQTDWANFKDQWKPRMVTQRKSITHIYQGTDDDGQGAPMVIVGTTEMDGKTQKHFYVNPNKADDLTWFPKVQDADQIIDMAVGNLPQARVAYILYRASNNIILEVSGLPDPDYHVSFGAQLNVPAGAMQLDVDYNDFGYSDLKVTGNGEFVFDYNNQTQGSTARKTKEDAASIAIKITTHTSLTEDYKVESGNVTPFNTYRTIFNFPSDVVNLDIWASEETAVEIAGNWYTIDPIKPVRVQPNQMNRIAVNIPATQFSCPTLRIHTNTMSSFDRFFACPDVDLHKKILDLNDGALHDNRDKLGIKPEFDKDACDHVQAMMQSMVKAVQYSYNRTPHGFHHDRAVLAKNMDDSHFMMDFSAANGATYQPLSKEQVQDLTKGAKMLNGATEQGFFDSIGHFVTDAGQIIVHTAENVAHDVVDTAKHMGKDVINTLDKVGEDLITGNILHIGEDIMQGGENMGRDLFTGATNVVGDLISGAGQLVVVTLKYANEAYQFIIHHTGVIGEFIGKIIEKIGATIEKAIAWLLSKLDWSDILHTHDFFVQEFNSGMDTMKTFPLKLKEISDKFFSSLEKTINDDVENAVNQLTQLTTTTRPAPVAHQSNAEEKIHWIMSRFSENAQHSTDIQFPAIVGEHDGIISDLLATLRDKLGANGETIIESFQSSFDFIEKIFKDPSHSPEYLLGAFLELMKALAITSLEIINTILDVLLDLVALLLEAFKGMMNEKWEIPFISDLYKMITDGKELTFLSFISLVAAIPVTLIHKAMFSTLPFQDFQEVTSGLPDQGSKITGWGISYGVFHLILGPIAVVKDGKSLLDYAADIDYFGDKDPNPASSLSKFDFAMNLADVLFGWLAQFSANPIPMGEPYMIPLDNAKNDVFEAPSYWAHVIWWYQWGGLSINTLATGGISFAQWNKVPVKGVNIAGDVMAGFNFAYGIVHMALMAVLDVADREKANLLNKLGAYHWGLSDKELALFLQDLAEREHSHTPYFDVTIKTDEEIAIWVKNIRIYHEFAQGGGTNGGIPRKGFGNIMDTFPEIGKLGVSPKVVEATEGISLLVTAGLDLLGHLGEGITYIVRTDKHELL